MYINNTVKTKHYPTYLPHSRGFTLIELLTVIAIIGVLAGILIPAVSKVRMRAQETKKATMYRQYFVANTMYANDNKGYSVVAEDNRTGTKENWRTLLAPYLADSSMTKTEINKAEIYACPFYQKQNPEKHWETGIGINLKLRLPENNTPNAFWANPEGWEDSKETKLNMITYPERRPLFGDVVEQFSFGNVERLDTTRHDGKGMFVRFDGSIAYLSQGEAELALLDPSKRYTPE